ncbi:hypothetical protein AHAS_Ahas19G0199700 [Arachis hypogaea]
MSSVPRLGSQVARPSDFLGLTCHAFNTNWRATPLCSSGTPIVIDGPALWNFVLACHTHMHAWTSSLDFSTGVPRPASCLSSTQFLMFFSPEIQHNSSQSSVP